MATTTKALARTAAATSSTTLYTVPNTSTTTIVTSIVVTNSATSAATFTIAVDSVDMFTTTALAANSTAIFDMKQVIPANATPKTISGFASATTVRFHISGIEVS
jgi:hypothetical protein